MMTAIKKQIIKIAMIVLGEICTAFQVGATDTNTDSPTIVSEFDERPTSQTNSKEVSFQKGEWQLFSSRKNLGTTHSPNISMFAGGECNEKPSNAIDIFILMENNNLRNDFLHFSYSLIEPRSCIGAANYQDYFFFAGGKNSVGISDLVDIIVISNNYSINRFEERLSEPRSHITAISFSNGVIFAGGDNHGSSKTVDIFYVNSDKSITKKRDTLTCGGKGMVAIKVGEYILFAGGTFNEQCSNIVDIFRMDQNGTVNHSTAHLAVPRTNLAAAIVDNCAIFAGGRLDNGAKSDVVDVFQLIDNNSFLHRTMRLDLPRDCLCGAYIQDTSLFAGGSDANNHAMNIVDIFTMENGELHHLSETLLNELKNLEATSFNNQYIFFAGGCGDDDQARINIEVWKTKNSMKQPSP